MIVELRNLKPNRGRPLVRDSSAYVDFTCLYCTSVDADIKIDFWRLFITKLFTIHMHDVFFIHF